MKIFICQCLICIVVNFAYSQSNNIELSYYNYNYSNKFNNWKWISGTYNHVASRNCTIGIGIGYNITPLFVDNVTYPNAIPKNKNQLSNINFNTIIRFHFDLKKENIDFYSYNKFNINRTQFISTNLYSVNEIIYYKNTYSDPEILLDNTFGIGLDITLYKQTHIFIRSGFVFHYKSNSLTSKESFNINDEIGIRIDLKTKKDQNETIDI